MSHQKAKYYQDSVEELRRVFYRLNLVMIGEAAIHFIDSEVFRLCLPMWDVDGDGFISVAEAQKVQRITQGSFNGNDKITTIDDLDKFSNGYIYHSGSNVITIGSTVFSDYSSLEIEIDMPLAEGKLSQVFSSSGIISARFGKITEASYFALAHCPNLRYVVMPDTLTIIGNSCFNGSKALEYIGSIFNP